MNIIVGITSWSKRIHEVGITVQSLLNQTVKPDKIELNLDYENFPNGLEDVPEEIKKLPIDIYFYPVDYKCWLKIVPTIRRHLGDDYVLFTVDDDVTYPPHYIEQSIKNLLNSDWLCSQDDKNTFGQYMVYKSNILNKIVPVLDNKLITQNKLDDITIFHLINMMPNVRGKRIKETCIDRNVGYSYRRLFVKCTDASKITDTNTSYPNELVEKEKKYLMDLNYQFVQNKN